jgi:two-component system NarL family response regulator
MTVSILLVDDHRMVREGLRAVLERDERYTIVGEAGGGREAVTLAAALKPDVVVMDVAMSDLNGIEATRQIASCAPHARVVALSSHGDRRYVRAILGAGAYAYVLKENASDDLRRAVDSALSGKRYLCAEVTGDVIDSALDKAASADSCDRLSARELEVLQLIAEGHTSSEISQRLHISTATVETHRRNIMRKLDLHSVAELTKYAVREGVTALEPSARRGRP